MGFNLTMIHGPPFTGSKQLATQEASRREAESETPHTTNSLSAPTMFDTITVKDILGLHRLSHTWVSTLVPLKSQT